MNSAPPEPRGNKSFTKSRRLSFLDLSKNPSHTGSKSKTMKYIGVNFYFSQIKGLPASWLKQYRIVVRSGDLKSTTSWKASVQSECRVDETTEGMKLLMNSELTFLLEKRNILSKPLLIGDTRQFLVSDLASRQEAHRSRVSLEKLCVLHTETIDLLDPFILELDSKGEYPSLLLELSVRLFPGHDQLPDVPDGESRALIVYEVYPDTISGALVALREFTFVLSDPSQQMSCRTLSEMVDHMGKYILDHPRKKLSYECENNAWLFLKETTKCLKALQASSAKADQTPENFAYLASRILRGFWLLLQLHIPGILDYDNRHINFIKLELLKIGDSFTRKPNPPVTKLDPMEYPPLLLLKAAHMTPPSLQAPRLELLSCNTLFKDIARWLVHHDPEHQVFWLHGKFESGTANQIIAALLETSKMSGFPTTYYSFQNVNDSKDNQNPIQSMFRSMITQLSRCNQTLAGAFDATMMKSIETFESLDVHSQFQMILHTLHSLNFSEQANSFPILLIIDYVEPSNAGLSSLEYSQLLQLLHTASVATRAVTPCSSSVPGSSFSPGLSPTSLLGARRDSLSLPPFLRTIALSRSLGKNPSLIEQFAFIRADSYRSTRCPNDKQIRLCNSAVNGSHRSKAGEHVPLHSAPLTPIIEVNSQACEV